MKAKGVIACILQLKVLSTRSSILCMVLASNTNFDSPTCRSRDSGTSVSSILAASDRHATANNCIIQA
uniref:Uncharacterized protein n=1 Tax=Rhizophora mucronata TaxID=61149 RepID=A0A2P2NLU6_RHIMU